MQVSFKFHGVTTCSVNLEREHLMFCGGGGTKLDFAPRHDDAVRLLNRVSSKRLGRCQDQQ